MKEEELKNKEEEAFDLVIHLADAVSKGIYWESKVILANQRLDMVLDLAKEVDWRVKEIEAKACTMEEKVALVASHAIEDFKGLEDFKSKGRPSMMPT